MSEVSNVTIRGLLGFLFVTVRNLASWSVVLFKSVLYNFVVIWIFLTWTLKYHNSSTIIWTADYSTVLPTYQVFFKEMMHYYAACLHILRFALTSKICLHVGKSTLTVPSPQWKIFLHGNNYITKLCWLTGLKINKSWKRWKMFPECCTSNQNT